MRNSFVLLAFLLPIGCGKEVAKYEGTAFATDPPPPAPMNGAIVTTDNGSDTLSVVDLATGQLRTTLPVGFIPVELEGPHHVSADASGTFYYVNLSEAVAGSGSGPHGTHGSGTIPGYVLKMRARDGSLAGYVRVDPNPGDNVLSPDGRTLYVTHYDLLQWTRGAAAGDLRRGDSRLFAIDTETLQIQRTVPLCPAAHGVRMTPDGGTLYATCGPDEIARVDLPAMTVTRVLLPGVTSEGASCTACPYALSIAPDGNVWVSSLGPNAGAQGGSVALYDPVARSFDASRTVSFIGRAVFSAFTHGPVGSDPFLAYVPEQGAGGDWVHVLAPAASGPPRELAKLGMERQVCQNAHMILLSEDDRMGYLICEGDHVGPGSLVVLDLTVMPPRVVGSVAVGVFPDGMAIIAGTRP